MFIRTQNNDVIVNPQQIAYYYIEQEQENQYDVIAMATTSDSNCIVLGSYSTIEQAQLVLINALNFIHRKTNEASYLQIEENNETFKSTDSEKERIYNFGVNLLN